MLQNNTLLLVIIVHTSKIPVSGDCYRWIDESPFRVKGDETHPSTFDYT